MTPAAMPLDATPSATESWRARLRLAFELRRGRTVLAAKHQSGPLTVQRPFYPEDGACHLYLLHPPGGVVGGDRLEIEIEAASGTHALLTTPGATKLYRSDGPVASINQRLQVADGARLEWLPQENILFAGTRARLETEVRLLGDGRFLGWEIHCLGRPASGETFTRGNTDLALRIFRDEHPLLLERLRVRDGMGLEGPSGLRGHPVTATLLATSARDPDVEAARAELAEHPETLGAVTRLDDLLVARVLGHSTEAVREQLTRLWRALRPRLIGAPPCAPRIWST